MTKSKYPDSGRYSPPGPNVCFSALVDSEKQICFDQGAALIGVGSN